MPLLQPRRTIDEPDPGWGIYLWQLPDGSYVKNDDGDYLLVGPIKNGNRKALDRLAKAAYSLGIKGGQPFYLPGFRPVTQTEWEDQMERLLDGKVPDLVDVYRQAEMNVES